jgi:hypothetical protein
MVRGVYQSIQISPYPDTIQLQLSIASTSVTEYIHVMLYDSIYHSFVVYDVHNGRLKKAMEESHLYPA